MDEIVEKKAQQMLQYQ